MDSTHSVLDYLDIFIASKENSFSQDSRLVWASTVGVAVLTAHHNRMFATCTFVNKQMRGRKRLLEFLKPPVFWKLTPKWSSSLTHCLGHEEQLGQPYNQEK